MNINEFKNYCLAKKGVEETYPMKGEVVWMKVKGKLFAMTNVTEFEMNNKLVQAFHFINLKCDPEKAIKLRTLHPSIEAGWHQNKKHWNTLYMNGSLSNSLIEELIDHSYEVVINSLPDSIKEELL